MVVVYRRMLRQLVSLATRILLLRVAGIVARGLFSQPLWQDRCWSIGRAVYCLRLSGPRRRLRQLGLAASALAKSLKSHYFERWSLGGIAGWLHTVTSGHLWASAGPFEAMPFDRGGGPYQYRRSPPSRHEAGHRGRPSGLICAINSVLKVRPQAHCKPSSGGEYPLG